MLRIMTWNVDKLSDKKTADNVISFLEGESIDCAVFQEIHETLSNYILKNKYISEFHSKFMKRTGADPQEGGYLVLIRKIINEINTTVNDCYFLQPIITRPIPDNNPKGPGIPRRPPLLTIFETKGGTPIHLLTWHAPHDDMMTIMGASAALNTIRLLRPMIAADFIAADNKKIVWILAADLNINSTGVDDIFLKKKGFRRVRVSKKSLDHIICRYNKGKDVEISTIKCSLANKAHAALAASIYFS